MTDYTQPYQYWGVSPQTAATFPLGLRTSNNLFNIKYYPGAEQNQTKWPGLIGPSTARDQGDPQMQFANPEDSGVAGAMLLRRKYDAGQRTPQQIIAGQNGWTPGRMDSANAVAGYAGVQPNADLRLDTPEGMRRFLPALATQEHGTWARDKLFSDNLFDKIAERATGAQFASGDLPPLEQLKDDGSNAHRWTGGPQRPVQQPNTPAAASPRGPQPMADPYQPQQPEQSPFNSFLDRLQSPLTQQGMGLLMASMQGKDMNEGMSAGMARGNQFLQQQQQRQLQAQEQAKKQAISQMLADPSSMQGVPPALVNLARATQNVDPVAQFLVKASQPPTSDDIKEYEYAVKGGFKGAFTEWMAQKKQHGGDYAKQLVYGTDAAGNIVPMQAGSRGDLVASKLPPGVMLQRDPLKIDGPTGTALIDPTTRTQIGFIPKQIAQAEIDKSVGETIAKARANLPMAEQTFKNAQEMLNKIRSHEALVKGYGVGVGSYIPAIHGTSVKDFDALVEQAKGGAFLQAAQNMRGLGALTETEGRAATQAVTRMNRALTKEAFLEALKDYENIMERGLAVTRAQAQIGRQPAGAPPPGVIQTPQRQQPAPAPAGNGGWSMEKVQ